MVTVHGLSDTVHMYQYLSVTTFSEQDSFVGYQNDTSASVVFQATEQLREEQEGAVNEEMEESEEWQDLIMERSKSLLIQMATPDALIRLQCTQLAEEERRKITAAYTEQHHGSISDFVCHHLQRQFGGVDEEGGLLLHVSTKTRSSTLCHLIFFSPGNHTQSLAVLH